MPAFNATNLRNIIYGFNDNTILAETNLRFLLKKHFQNSLAHRTYKCNISIKKKNHHFSCKHRLKLICSHKLFNHIFYGGIPVNFSMSEPFGYIKCNVLGILGLNWQYIC